MPYKDHQKNIDAINRIVYRNIEYTKRVKSEMGCSGCGTTEVAVLDFHHRDPSNKGADISRLARSGRSVATIQKEIDKCDVMCCNCHRMTHYNASLA